MFYQKSVLKKFTKSPENTCTGMSFLIKLHAVGLQYYQKRGSGQVFSREFGKSFKNIYFAKQLLTMSNVQLK